MKSFDQFLSEKTNLPAVHSIVRNLLEAGINPVEYVRLRLNEEDMPPMQAAASASMPPSNNAPQGQMAPQKATDPQEAIKQMSDIVNQLLQSYGKTHPATTRIVTNIASEVEQLNAALVQDQQKQATQQNAPQSQAAPPVNKPKIGNAAQQQPQQQQMPAGGMVQP